MSGFKFDQSVILLLSIINGIINQFSTFIRQYHIHSLIIIFRIIYHTKILILLYYHYKYLLLTIGGKFTNGLAHILTKPL